MSIEKDLSKKYGDGVIITGDQLKKIEHKILHVSPKLDLILGGGIPGGTISILVGDPKCGKSITTLHIAGNAQKAGRPVYYLNVEGRIKSRDIEGIKSLDSSKLHIVKSHKDENESRILTAEEFLSIAEGIVHNEPGAVIIIDSISQLITSGEFSKDMGEQSRAPGPVLMSQFLKKVSNTVPVNDIIIIGVLHYIANTSGYGKAKLPSGGRKILYAADIALEAKKFKLLIEGAGEDGTGGRAYGQEVEWSSMWTAIAPPGQSTTSTIKYGTGIDETAEMVQLAIDFGLIKKAASWFSLMFLNEENPKKIQGEKSLIEFFEIPENLPDKEKLEKLINNMIYSN